MIKWQQHIREKKKKKVTQYSFIRPITFNFLNVIHYVIVSHYFLCSLFLNVRQKLWMIGFETWSHPIESAHCANWLWHCPTTMRLFSQSWCCNNGPTIPSLLQFIFGLFQTTLYFLQQISVKNVHPVLPGAGIEPTTFRTWVSSHCH